MNETESQYDSLMIIVRVKISNGLFHSNGKRLRTANRYRSCASEDVKIPIRRESRRPLAECGNSRLAACDALARRGCITGVGGE